MRMNLYYHCLESVTSKNYF